MLSIAIGAALGANLELRAEAWLWVALFALVGTFIDLNAGFIIAGLTKSPQSATSAARIVVSPLFLLTGAFFPREAYPAACLKRRDTHGP